MRRVIAWAIRNSPSMNTLMVAVLVTGAACALKLRRERYPDFRPDEITISVNYPGASPAETEQAICLPVEEAIRSIVGIRKVVSSAREGQGSVTAELDTDVDDPGKVLDEVQSAIDRVTTFPVETEKPVVKLPVRFNPVISVSIIPPAGSDPDNDPIAERQLRAVTDQVYEELMQLPDMSYASQDQSKNYQIDIEISQDTLRKYGLTHRDVADAVRKSNVELPAGSIRTKSGEVLIRASNRHVTGREIAKIPVLTDENGTSLTVGDLGTVKDGFDDREIFLRLDGRPHQWIMVRMTPDEDMLTIRDQVFAYAAAKQMPDGYKLKVWGDWSKQARDRLDLVTRNGIMGLLLVFGVLGLFLDLRLAMWVSLGIPISVFGTCAIMLACGATLNVYSMFAFVMAMGIVVDDAIVIAENVYAHRLTGKSAVQAAIDGTAEVASSVINSVLTTVIAFIPLAYVSGDMGKWIAVMPLGLISMLLISLFEALFILPCHLAHSRLPERESEVPGFQRRVQAAVSGFIDRAYVPAFRWTLAHPAIVISGSIATMLLTIGLYRGGYTPFVFSPRLDWEFVYTYVEYPKGTPQQTVIDATARLDAAFREVEREHLRPGGETLVTTSTRSVGRSGSQDRLRGDVYAEFDPKRVFETTSSQEIVKRWREKAGEFPGAERVVFWGLDVSPGGRPVELSLLGSNIDELESVAGKIKARLATYKGVYDIQDSRGPGKWELPFTLKPEAEALGVDLEHVARTVRAAFHGEEVMRLQRGRHEIKLMVRNPEAERRSLHQLDEIPVLTKDGDEVPLPVLANITARRGYSTIKRIDQQRAVTITANVDETQGNALNIVNDLQSGFLSELLQQHPTVHGRWEGQQEQTRRSFTSLMIGFSLAVFGMYALLTLEFKSYFQPIIILAVLPFGLVGALLGHLLLGQVLTLFSLFGAVTLAGIIANDSIVLVDFINRRLKEGAELADALLESGRRRFRPVMLTSITTVAALLPILAERNTQAQVIIPMAISISFGLIVATLWILFLVPAIFSIYAKCVHLRKL
ncbi:MAG: efflux RND transporter permease subunit [Planctomycetota bacterium]|nr:efflux RND transporter permease subunit [Planctomycetota bacterium]